MTRKTAKRQCPKRKRPAKARKKPAARPARRPRRARPRPSAPSAATVASKPLGKVATIIIERGGKSFMHQFPPSIRPGLFVADAGKGEGVLVIRGDFTVDADGFIRE